MPQAIIKKCVNAKKIIFYKRVSNRLIDTDLTLVTHLNRTSDRLCIYE